MDFPSAFDAFHELYEQIPTNSNGGAVSTELAEALRQKKLVIYGAGASGRLLAGTLDSHALRVEFFVDRAAAQIGRVHGIPVYDPRRLSELSSDYLVIVAVNLRSQYETLCAAVRDHNGNLPVLEGLAVNRLLRYRACSERLLSNEPYDLIECENCGFERHECPLALSYLKKVGQAAPDRKENGSSGSERFDWFGYIVGQVCTLNCIHCCEAVPFLKQHRFVDPSTIISDVRKVAEASRFLKFVELIGGEPFAHPNIGQVLLDLLQIKNIGYVKVFTNATIVPDDSLCDTLKNPRIMLQVSNYEKRASGRLLEHILSTRKKLAEERVPYIFSPNLEWRDFSSFDLHNADPETLETVFRECPLLNCHRLHEGTLYRCPHHYAGVQLGKLAKHEVECVDINEFENGGLAKALDAFENVSYIDACRYCTMPFDAAVVPAGEQLPRNRVSVSSAS